MPVQVRLNRTGINSIEMPESADVEVGKSLELSMINYGGPLHLTVSALNAKNFTHFIHENMYLDDKLVLKIPILSIASIGTFTIEMITGYGTVKEQMEICVHDQEIEVPEIIEEIEETDDEKIEIPWAAVGVVVLAALAWIAYIIGFFYPGQIPVIIPMVLLTAGVLIGWFLRPS